MRVTRSVQLPQNINLPDQCSIRLINTNGSGDREILSLGAGQWISQMAWSPDGSRLLFDMGPQVVVNNIPYAQSVPQTVEIHTINMNTLVPSRVHTAPAVWPAWRPASTPADTVPQLSIRTVPSSNKHRTHMAGRRGEFSTPVQSHAFGDMEQC